MPVPAQGSSRSARRGVEPLEPRWLMSTVNVWKAAVSGSWEDASKWSLGHVPRSTEDVAITAAGSYTVAVHGTDDVANSVTLGTATSHGPALALAASDAAGFADLYVIGTFANDGTVSLSDTSGNGFYPQLTATTLANGAAATLAATGSAAAVYGDFINAPVTNAGTIADSAAHGLYVNGGLTQTAAGTFAPTVGAGPTVVTGPAALAGRLDVHAAAGFTPTAGTDYSVLTYTSHTGGFSSTDGLQVNGVTLTPTTAATGVDLRAAGSDHVAPTVTGFTATRTVKAATVAVTVTYADNVAINAATLGNGNVIVTGPGGFSAAAKLTSVSPTGNGSPRTATYTVSPRGGYVDVEANGTYTVKVLANSVKDTSGNAVAATTAGTFTIAVTPHLAFTTQPKATVAGKAIAAGVKVEDARGNVLTTDASKVTVATASGAKLAGTTTVTAAKGVATFANLVLTTAAAYTLRATDGADASATSASFAITAAAAAKLAFSHAPASGKVGHAISPAVTVAVEDAYGNVVTSNTSTVTISISTGPSGGKLTGTTAVAAKAGVATFSNLVPSKAGAYKLKAADGALSSVVTGSFTVA